MTNDAERVSDKLLRWNFAEDTMEPADDGTYVYFEDAADIIEAQSKALAEAREALLVADEHLTGIENYGGEPAVRARRGRAAIEAALGDRP